MCDTIVYNKEGEKCGIEPDIIGSIRLNTYTHYVCNPGLACFIIKDFQGFDVERCITVKKKIGEDCIVDYNHCFNTYTCKRNQYDEYTCDGKALWKGNIGMNSNSFTSTIAEENVDIIIIGITIFSLWLIGLFLFVASRLGKTEPDLDSSVNIKPKVNF